MEIEENIEGTTVPVGGSIVLIDKLEGTIVPDTGRKADLEAEGDTHLKRAEDTLAIKDEVVAKGPLVMEGP